MQVYLVGGAVRDSLLGLTPQERDWVVVGATPQMLLVQGYRQVGKDFPVFLHPDTQEEYALARRERKSGQGYSGFVVDASVQVTLEEDLLRRDLTINAIAQDEHGHFIDPFHGRQDLIQKTLRHVSPAFIEDPLRILRLARFAARFPDFTIALQTQTLVKDMVQAGEIEHLVAERVWVEIEKVLNEPQAVRFFAILHHVGAFFRLFPSLPQTPALFSQGCHYLEKACAQTSHKILRFALFLYPFFQTQSRKEIESFCADHCIPNTYKNFILMCYNALPLYQTIMEKPTAEKILKLIEQTDAARKPQQLQDFLEAVSIIFPSADSVQIIVESAEHLKRMKIADLLVGIAAAEIPIVLRQARLNSIKSVLTSYR